MGGLSLTHWLVFFAVVLIFFGPKRLPELAKGLGQSIREFKKHLNEDPNQPQPPVHNPVPPAQIASHLDTTPVESKPIPKVENKS